MSGAHEQSPVPSRRDTRLEAEGAEFLVLGSLLAEGIPACKAYTNFPGYDILAGDPSGSRRFRIQVKSAYWTGNRSWQIRNFDCDFICCVAPGWTDGNTNRAEPDAWTFSGDAAIALRWHRRLWQDAGRIPVGYRFPRTTPR
jgi:hypothetical protein